MKVFFEKHLEVEEFEFFNSKGTAVMFACVVELSDDDLVFGIERCASNTNGHSFLYVQQSDDDGLPFHIRDIFYYAEITNDSHSNINWERLVDFLEKFNISPIQSWSDSYEYSLKFYDLDLLKLFYQR